MHPSSSMPPSLARTTSDVEPNARHASFAEDSRPSMDTSGASTTQRAPRPVAGGRRSRSLTTANTTGRGATPDSGLDSDAGRRAAAAVDLWKRERARTRGRDLVSSAMDEDATSVAANGADVAAPESGKAVDDGVAVKVEFDDSQRKIALIGKHFLAAETLFAQARWNLPPCATN